LNRSIFRVFSYFLVAILPGVITLVLIRLIFQTDLSTFLPFHNDEVGYWHEINTYTNYSFAGGYYNIEEKTSQATFSPFGEHGPFFALLYGTIGKITGWTANTGVYINIGLIFLSILAYLWIIKPTFFQTAVIGGFLCTCWVLLLYVASNLQESLHQAAGIIVACLFWKLLSTSNKSKFRYMFIILTAVFILLISIPRFTWLLLFIPFIYILFKDKPLHLIIGFLIAIVLILLLTWIIASLYAPYPEAFYPKMIGEFQLSFSKGFSLLLHHTKSNLRDYLQAGRDDPFLGIVQRYQVLLILATLFGLWFYRVIRRKTPGRKFFQESPTLVTLLLVFVPIFLSQIMFYDIYYWRDYRVFGPYILLTILLLISFEKKVVYYSLVGILIACNLLFISYFYQDFIHFHWAQFYYDQKAILKFQTTAHDILIYNYYPNHWCNTLLTNNYPQEFLGIPAGIGISFVMDPERVEFPLKSKYLLLEDKIYKEWLHNHSINTQFLATSQFGNFYLNLDARCN